MGRAFCIDDVQLTNYLRLNSSVGICSNRWHPPPNGTCACSNSCMIHNNKEFPSKKWGCPSIGNNTHCGSNAIGQSLLTLFLGILYICPSFFIIMWQCVALNMRHIVTLRQTAAITALKQKTQTVYCITRRQFLHSGTKFAYTQLETIPIGSVFFQRVGLENKI